MLCFRRSIFRYICQCSPAFPQSHCLGMRFSFFCYLQYLLSWNRPLLKITIDLEWYKTHLSIHSAHGNEASFFIALPAISNISWWKWCNNKDEGFHHDRLPMRRHTINLRSRDGVNLHFFGKTYLAIKLIVNHWHVFDCSALQGK